MTLPHERAEEDRIALATFRSFYHARYESLGHIRQAPAPLVPSPNPGILITNSVLAGALPRLAEPGLRVVGAQPCVRYGGVSSFHTTAELGHGIETGDRSVFFEQVAVVQAMGLRPLDAQMRDLLAFLTIDVGLDPARLRATFHVEDGDLRELWTRAVDAPVSTQSTQAGHRSSFLAGRLGRALHLVADLQGCCQDHPPSFGDAGGNRSGEATSLDCPAGCRCGRWLDVADLIVFEDLDGVAVLTDSGLSLDRLLVAGGAAPLETEVAECARLVPDLAASCPDGPVGDVRFLADHLRAAAILFAHQLLPSNKGAGYVLKRMVRRSALRAMSLGLGAEPTAWAMCLAGTLASDTRPGVPPAIDPPAALEVFQGEFEACARLVERARCFLDAHADPATGRVHAEPDEWARARNQDGLGPEVFSLAARHQTGAGSV